MGRRRLNDRIAGATRELLADVPDHLEARRHAIERLRHILADLAQRAAAGRTGTCRRMEDILARKMFRQLATRWFARFERLLDQRGEGRQSGRGLLRSIFLQGLDGELELGNGLRELLG
jgi:hypothetical protein